MHDPDLQDCAVEGIGPLLRLGLRHRRAQVDTHVEGLRRRKGGGHGAVDGGASSLDAVDDDDDLRRPARRPGRRVPSKRSTRRTDRAHRHAGREPADGSLVDLDVVNPGLLGSHKQFATWTKRLSAGPQGSFAPLRELVRPYILRRMKTDPSVIADLPAKTEVAAYSHPDAAPGGALPAIGR